MFLKEPAGENTAAGVVWQTADVVVRHPVRLQIRHWVVRFGDHWIVAGHNDALSVVARLLQQAAAREEAGIACVSTELATSRPRQSWFRRLLQRIRSGARPAEAGYFEEWIEGLHIEDELERRLLQEIDRALAELPGLLVLDRVVRVLRTQVRFRLSATLHDLCSEKGLAVIVLDERLPEGWGGCDRAALLSGGRFQSVMRSDLP